MLAVLAKVYLKDETSEAVDGRKIEGMEYRLVTLWASCLRETMESFAASCTVG